MDRDPAILIQPIRKEEIGLSLPTSTRILRLAQQCQLVRDLEVNLARAEHRGQLQLADLLKDGVALARALENEIQQMQVNGPAAGLPDRSLGRLLSVSLKLGPLLTRARALEQTELGEQTNADDTRH